MHKIIIALTVGLLILVGFQLICEKSPMVFSQDNSSLSKELKFNDNLEETAKKIQQKTKTYNPNPTIIWASEEVSYSAYDDAEINPQQWDKEWRVKFLEIRQFTSFTAPFKLTLFAYPSVERKAIRSQNMRAAHIDEGQVHIVSNSHFKGEEWGQQFRPLIRKALGQTKHEALEIGLAMQWCDSLKGSDLPYWANLLLMANTLPDLTTIYDKTAYEAASPLATKIAAASWVSYCLERWGKDWFLEHYHAASPSKETLTHWSNDWQNWVLLNAPLSIATINSYKGKRLNGFTLAHEGYRIYNGYGSELSRRSIEYLSSIGTDAIAIVPYSYMRSPNKASHIPIMNGPGMENDESVIFAHSNAQALGQFTLLKPQIWLNTSWPGDVDFKNKQTWQQFFDHYRTWIMHYAILAEMNGFDAFCIGTELRYATLKYPGKWSELIQDIRKIFHGSLTYAANWGEECEKITFWNELDFIGVNCYYPLHKQDNATETELRQGAKRNITNIKKIHEQFNRPVWLTEVGFRSATAPWKSPHAEAGVRLIDDNAQALCYEVLLSEMQTENWLNGIFWWKWPANLNNNEDHGRGYMPHGKEAEEVVKKYYLNGGTK